MTIEEIRQMIVNKNATDETVALFYNLFKIRETGFIVGHHDTYSKFRDETGDVSDFVNSTGREPGLLGSDFMFITDDQNDGKEGNWYFEQEQQVKKHISQAYENGSLNAVSWHFREPFEGKEFESKRIKSWYLRSAFESILPGGENHNYYKSKLEKIAEVSGSLIGLNGEAIPIIFRPFHEFDGDWFWWGRKYCEPAQFVALWQFTVSYLTYDLGVNNMLFAYSPDNKFSSEQEYMERYPGDDYVDILAMDNYEDFKEQKNSGFRNAHKKLKIVSELASERNKIAALSETGFNLDSGLQPNDKFYSEDLYEVLTDNGIKLSFVMFWSNKSNEYFVPLSDHDSHKDFIEFMGKPEVLLINPNMYRLDVDPIA